MYNFNFHQLILLWMAPEERYPVREAWYRVFLEGLRLLYVDFLAWRERAVRHASATGQVMWLERMLNLRFYGVSAWKSLAHPTAGGRIWIDNTANAIPNTYIYSDTEQQPVVTIYSDVEAQPPVYIYSQAEYASQYDFIVMVPASLTFDQDEMTALVEEYKLGGVRFTIQTY